HAATLQADLACSKEPNGLRWVALLALEPLLCQERFMNLKTTALAAAVAAATWCMAPFASAQMQETTPPTAAHPTDPATDPSMRPPTPPPPGQAAPADPATPSQGAATTPVDQKKVEQFADAYVQVQTIQQKANADLQTTTDPAQADQVKSNAQSEMIAAVER